MNNSKFFKEVFPNLKIKEDFKEVTDEDKYVLFPCDLSNSELFE